jgi:predicted dehydrogenase
MAINAVAVIGTGFIGAVHVEAIRRTGNQVKGVLSSSEKSTVEAAQKLTVSKAYSSVAEICADDDISVVHVTSPNSLHVEQVEEIIAAGKHVICEKPLALTAAEGAHLLELAERAGVVHALCFNTRFYPMVHEARARIHSGEIGAIRYIHAQYHQDWLMLDTDWNWRLEPGKAGALRAVADIGSHLLDQLGFVTGEEIEAVFAELHTLVKSRNRPMGEVQTFTSAGAVPRERVEMSSDDAAGILLRFKNGAHATLSISQISGGSKNSLKWEIAGSKAAVAFDAQSPEELWIGNRGTANEVLHKDPSLLSPEAAAIAFYPGGHVEGFGETFRGLFQTIYARIEDPSRPIDYPTFADGVRSLKITDAIVASSHTSQWINLNS